MAVERRWTIHVCEGKAYEPWNCTCDPPYFEKLEVVPASGYDRLLSACKEEVELLRRRAQINEDRTEDPSVPDRAQFASSIRAVVYTDSADRFQSVIQSLEGEGR